MKKYAPSRLLLSRTNETAVQGDDIVADRLEWLEAHAATLKLPQVWQNRFRSATNFVTQNLIETGLDLASATALEVGCGNGAKSCALAPLFREYIGVDLFYSRTKYAQWVAHKGGLGNARFHPITVEALEDFIVSGGRKFDVIFLVAVLEHLTPFERLNVIRAAYAALTPNGFLYIGETPNRLSAADHHSFFLPYFDLLPPELASRYVGRTPRKAYLERVDAADDREQEMYRCGKGVSFHEFELAIAELAKLEPLIQLDGFDLIGQNSHPLRNYEALQLEEFRIVRRDPRTAWIAPPPFFARHYFEGVITKTPVERAIKGTPRYLREGSLAGTGIGFLETEQAAGYSCGYPQHALTRRGEELVIPLPRRSGGRFTIAVDKASKGVIRFSTGGDTIVEVDVASVLEAQPPFWIEFCVLGADIPGPAESVTLTVASDGASMLVHAPCWRPFAAG